ncbi:RuvB-like protein 1 [Pancytospora philotis]|nr:RuvB-like protein 1 [Pancytospora philotis]
MREKKTTPKKSAPSDEDASVPKKACTAKDSKDTSAKDIAKILAQELSKARASDRMVQNTQAKAALEMFCSSPYVSSALLLGDEAVCTNLVSSIEGFVKVVGAEEIADADDAVRTAANIRFTKAVTVFEGEVLSIQMHRDDADAVKGFSMVIGSAKGRQTLQLEKHMREAVAKINEGDLVYIEPNAGFIKRIGRSESRIDEYDLEGDNYAPVNKGPVSSEKVRDTLLTLHDLDHAFSGYSDEISCFARAQTDAALERYDAQGCVDVLRSFLVVTKAHQLSRDVLAALSWSAKQHCWVKLILIGQRGLTVPDGCLVVKAADEDPLDILEAQCENFAVYRDAAREQIGKLGLDVIRDAIHASRSLEDYRAIVAALLN